MRNDRFVGGLRAIFGGKIFGVAPKITPKITPFKKRLLSFLSFSSRNYLVTLNAFF
jgi:hypothetical protein